MKKFLVLSTLFMSLAFISNKADAQTVYNYTDCSYIVRAYIAPIGSCSITGGVTVTVAGNSSVALTIPTGYHVVAYRGYETWPVPNAGSFGIGYSCTGHPDTDTVGGSCNSNAAFDTGGSADMKIYY